VSFPHRPLGSPLLRKKLAIRLQEAAEDIGVANARNAFLERVRHQLQLELGDALSDLGKSCSVVTALEQKQQQSDRALADWKQKLEESQALLDASQKEARALSTEVLKLKHAYEESSEGQETLRLENKNLQGTLGWACSQSNCKDLGTTLATWRGCPLRAERLSIFIISTHVLAFQVLLLHFEFSYYKFYLCLIHSRSKTDFYTFSYSSML
jgi:hypothetical protein